MQQHPVPGTARTLCLCGVNSFVYLLCVSAGVYVCVWTGGGVWCGVQIVVTPREQGT